MLLMFVFPLPTSRGPSRSTADSVCIFFACVRFFFLFAQQHCQSSKYTFREALLLSVTTGLRYPRLSVDSDSSIDFSGPFASLEPLLHSGYRPNTITTTANFPMNQTTNASPAKASHLAKSSLQASTLEGTYLFFRHTFPNSRNPLWQIPVKKV